MREVLRITKMLCLIITLLTVVLSPSLYVLSDNHDYGIEGVRIAVSFNYLKYDIEPILCKGDEITAIAPEGVDPHDYELRPQDIELLSKSDVIVITSHTPFELKVKELVNTGLIKAILIELPYIEGIKVLDNPLLNKPNLHGITYDPKNLKTFIKYLVHILTKLRPECAGEYLRRYENYSKIVDNLVKDGLSLIGRRSLNVIISSPPLQYALEWLNFNISYMLIREHGVPPSPTDLAFIEELMRSGKVDLVAVTAILSNGEYVVHRNSAKLVELAKKYGVPVVKVPSPLVSKPTISKLNYVLDQLRSMTFKHVVSEVKKLSYVSAALLDIVALMLVVITIAMVLGYLRHILNPKVLLTVITILIMYVSAVTSILYDVKWVLVVTSAGLAYGVLSSVVAARRLYFLAAATPHSALLAAVSAIALTYVVGLNEYVWSLLIGIGLVYIVGFMIFRGVDPDVATSVFVASTSALSVIMIYYVLTNFRYSADVLTIIIGNPLLATWSDVAYSLILAIVIALLTTLTYYRNVYLGLDREGAMVLGIPIWLYDLTVFTSLGLAVVGLIKVVGFVLEHILILLPSSIALTVSRSAKDTIVVSTLASLTAATLGLYLAAKAGIAVSGAIGVILLTTYTSALTIKKIRGT